MEDQTKRARKDTNSQFVQTEVGVSAIDRLFKNAVKEFAKLAMESGYDGKGQFFFEDYPHLYKKAEKIVKKLAGDIEAIIGSGTSSAWTSSNKNSDRFIKAVLANAGVPDGTKVYSDTIGQYFNSHQPALEQFQKRVINGMNLSTRVWNYAENSRLETQLGISISEAIRKGKSADALAEEIQHHLSEPDRLYRRVRDEFGTLQLSKNAKDYGPGTGVYRSSYRNAERLARNEINLAYRKAENLKYQQFDFVVGKEIKRSTHRDEKGREYNCPDICEKLKGKYPPDFEFTGWHVNCRCFEVPILATPQEVNEAMMARLRGEPYELRSVNAVTDYPDGFKEWVAENSDRIEASYERGNPPYFVKDNQNAVFSQLLDPKGKMQVGTETLFGGRKYVKNDRGTFTLVDEGEGNRRDVLSKTIEVYTTMNDAKTARKLLGAEVYDRVATDADLAKVQLHLGEDMFREMTLAKNPEAASKVFVKMNNYVDSVRRLAQSESVSARAHEYGDMLQAVAAEVAKINEGKVTPINYKKVHRIYEKVTDDGCTPYDLKDVVRTTVVVKTLDQLDKVCADIQANSKTPVTRYKIQTPEKFDGYSGRLFNVKLPNGMIGEIQANTDMMIYAKESPNNAKFILGEELWEEIHRKTGLEGGLGHKYYEMIRVSSTPEAEKLILIQKMREYYSHFR